MARRTGNWIAELAWLVGSTVLLTAAVVAVGSGFRWVLLAVLVVNVVVVGGTVRRFRRQAERPGRVDPTPS